MRPFKQIGPFGKAEAFLDSFVYNAIRQRIFMELLEELDQLEIVLEEGSEEEKKLAQMLHTQLTEQFMDMITPVNQDDKKRTGKNLQVP